MNPRKISKDVRVLIVLILLGMLFKGVLLWQRSNYIDPDEGYYLLLARNLVSGNGYTLNGLQNIIFPPLLPFLIALFYFVFHDLQVALGFITAVSGGLLGLVIYKICRLVLSSRYALAGAALALFIYPLNAFIPINKPYPYILYRGSDILNSVLVCAALFLTIRLVQTKKISYAAGAGVATSLAYLTRPEGFLFWLLTVVGLVVLAAVRLVRLPAKHILTLALTFLVCSSPYIFYLKNVTGEWMLSGKVEAGQDYRDALLKVIKASDWQSFNRVHYALDRDRLEMNDQYFGYHPTDRRDRPGLLSRLKNVGDNLWLSPVIPKVLFSYPLVPFFAIGLIGGLIHLLRKKSAFDGILFLAFLYSLGLAAISYPMPRHHLFLVPVFCVYSLMGIQAFLSFARRYLSRTITAVLVLSFVFFSFASDYIRYFDESVVASRNFKSARKIDREISKYLRDRGCRVLMSIQPGFAVWAFSDWQVLPNEDVHTLLTFAVKKRVDYVVLQESRGYHYRIIEMSGSVIPGSSSDKAGYQIIDAKDGFTLVRLIKPADDD
jgi:4-amino-4-deoxy-L-arabinose transferase-like glycosyltransferase